MHSNLSPSIADQALSANMETPTKGYKGKDLLSHCPSPPPSPLHPLTLQSSPSSSVPPKLDLTAASQNRHTLSFGPPSERQGLPLVSHNRLHDPPHHRPKALSIHPKPSTSSSATAPRKAPAGADHYDWTPIQLLKTPPSSHGKHFASLASTPRDASSDFRSPHSEVHHQLNRNAVWQSSPTLNTRRARKLSQHQPLLLSWDRPTIGAAPSSFLGSTMSSSVSDQISKPLQASKQKAFSSSPGPEQNETRRNEVRKMVAPTKPRALTLGSTDRPILPPLLGSHFQSHFGPVRSSFRQGAEYRHNPYFVSTPARKSFSYFALSPSARGPREQVLSPYSSGSKTPTSSMRSTTNGGHHQKVSPLCSSTSHTLLGAPLQIDSSPVGPRPSSTESVKQKEGGASSDTAVGADSHLPSSHLAAPDNALGLFLEPEPFPSELLHLDLAQTAQFGLSPRSEADFFLGQGGGSFNFLNSNSKSTSRVFTRSPANMSEASSLVPSPLTHSDDSLPKLSLAHRQDLNKSNTDPTLELPPLQLPDATPGFANLPPVVKPKAAFKDDSFIYKMPILRAMSPLADLSSDSDEDSDEPLATSSMLSRSTSLNDAAAAVETDHLELPVAQEGRTGEIFATLKKILPLTLKQPRGNTTEKLFCKLDSTSHQCFSVVDGKWACYRRNYLKVDVAFHFEDEQGRRRDKVSGDLICEATGRAPFTVERFAIHMTAHVMNYDGRLQKGRQGQVPLIQFGPARERGPREAVQPVEVRSGGKIGKDASANEQVATRSSTIAAFRRVQIRSATMNNGQRGAASQQFYALKLTLLAYPSEGPVSVGGGVEVASLTSHPITVRGRSKVHYAPAGTANKGGAAGNISRSLSAVPSANSKSAANPNRRRSHSRSRSVSTEQRRSTRLLLAADRIIEDDPAGSDGDDEEEVEQQPIRKVMDIRSII